MAVNGVGDPSLRQNTCNTMWFCDASQLQWLGKIAVSHEHPEVFTYYTDTHKCFLQGPAA